MIKDQFAFCPTGSTTSALIDLFQQLTTMLQRNEYAMLISMDFTRAFDHRRRLWGKPGHALPIIKMGANPLFCPPNNQTRIFYFCLFKKNKMKESRNRDNNRKKTEYILNERCKFFVRNFGENRRELFQDFLSENKFAQNFCPPIFVT